MRCLLPTAGEVDGRQTLELDHVLLLLWSLVVPFG